MRRLITCAALLLVAAAVVFSATRAQLARAGDATRRADDVVSRAHDSATPASARASATRTVPISQDATVAPESNPLREQYLERQRAKAELMSDDEIQQALDAMDKEIRVLESERDLKEAAAMLDRIKSQHLGTLAGSVADRMLQIYRDRDAPTRTPDYSLDPSTIAIPQN